MVRRAIPFNEITNQLFALGVQPGSILVVHTAFSKVAPVEDGPRGLIETLQTALGPAGTTIHLAENMAGVRYRRACSAMVLEDGQPKRYAYGEVDHCCENFAHIDMWLEKQHRGIVGHAEARLARSRDIVEVALARLKENETVFLHPAGLCGECDEARASLPG
jgi:aminoglycoside N3'-acetyltransferase